MAERKTLWRVGASYFTAGFVVTGTRVTQVAPILYRFKGKTIDWVRSYCRDHGWTCRIVKQ